ncbi:ergothioneine biosynthesis protein EgtB [Novosphingobium marinum]|uniref:Ergothioneine biosynthesis protein EgtB n=1 Tax=Novosphingobium marinum TaxID=1514948 RepID=A0A7Z0BWP6_9SPHN|nr:ergothioneine biosynthesis protein EgtB [Novosphingobium marinum]
MTLSERFRQTRALSLALADPLSDADATIQSMPDASPAKWHLAHTTWFFETFLLRDRKQGYALFNEDFPFLFNSYYEAEGARHARPERGMLSRPSLDELRAYRLHVDEAMEPLLDRPDVSGLIELGISHEQQHQELLLTDLKHALSRNPLGPAYSAYRNGIESAGAVANARWREHPGGIVRIGHEGEGFAFDNEGPSHRALVEPFALANRLVSNREWDEFVADGGYRTASLWLSDGWAWVNDEDRRGPLYWREGEEFTLSGWRERDADAPVTHISYYEADAFATWAGYRLPTECEWETMAQDEDAASGNQLDEAGAVHPEGSAGLFGDCWQWTRSGYLPYPRFQPADGAIGEYNGKFMSGQFVLKGASCATPRGHSRSSYRNFFYPHQRWQFTGLRLAKDI